MIILAIEGVTSMSVNKRWQLELEEYIRQGEPEQAEKSEAWQIAIGLQQVDGLQISAYLLDTAKEHIEGKLTIDEVQKRVQNYYKEHDKHTAIENATREADIVSARITQLLGEKTFQFSPAELMSIHRRLFDGVFKEAGKLRDYNITKNEWVLNGETVIYASCYDLQGTLDYDFKNKEIFSCEGLKYGEVLKDFVEFTSSVWQIHPFGEGNTRTIAVSIIKCLKSLGYKADYSVFKEHSWFFRNALVRANYNDLQKGIHATTKFLEMFFSNLLLGADYQLKNRYAHIDFDFRDEEEDFQSVIFKVPKGQNDTLECTLEELAVLKLLIENASISQDSLVKATGKSLSTIKRLMASLRERGIIRRVDGKRFGKWEVLVEIK